MKPMSQVLMASQYRPNISLQDIANTNIADGKSLLSQCGLTRERQRQYLQWDSHLNHLNGKPMLGQYIHIVWAHAADFFDCLLVVVVVVSVVVLFCFFKLNIRSSEFYCKSLYD